MSSDAPDQAHVIALRPPAAAAPAAAPHRTAGPSSPLPGPPAREPLWRHLVGEVLRRERLAQRRTLRDVAEAARISMPYLSEIERGRKEASSEVLAAAAHALGLGLADLLTLSRDELARFARARLAADATVVIPEGDPGAGAAGGSAGIAPPGGEPSARYAGPQPTVRVIMGFAA